MRIRFWCGAALAVAAASVVYLAAGYASRHPYSWVGRSLMAVYRAADPVSQDYRAADSRTGPVAAARPLVPPDADFPQEPAEEEMPPPAVRLPGLITVSDGVEFGVEVQTQAPLFPRDDEYPVGPRPAEDVPAVQVTDFVPSTMSYVTDEDDEAELFLWEYLRTFFSVEEVVLGTTGGEEQGEILYRPLDAAGPQHPYHPPSCPYTGSCPYPGRFDIPVRPAAPAVKEVLPAPVKKAPEADTMEFRRSDAKPDEFKRIPY
jgi:hypothetical protein